MECDLEVIVYASRKTEWFSGFFQLIPDALSHKRWWNSEELAMEGYRDFNLEDAANLYEVVSPQPGLGILVEGMPIKHDYTMADEEWELRDWAWGAHIKNLREGAEIQENEKSPWFFYDLLNTEAMETTEVYLQPLGPRKLREPVARSKLKNGRLTRLITARSELDSEANSLENNVMFSHLQNKREAMPGIFANYSRTIAIGRKSKGTNPLDGESSRMAFLLLRIANLSVCIDEGKLPLSTKASLTRMMGDYPEKLEPWIDVDWEFAKSNRASQCPHFRLDHWRARTLFEDITDNKVLPLILHSLIERCGKGAIEGYWSWPKGFKVSGNATFRTIPVTNAFTKRWLEAETVREMDNCLELSLHKMLENPELRMERAKEQYVGEYNRLSIPRRWATRSSSEWDFHKVKGGFFHYMIERVRLVYLTSAVTVPLVACRWFKIKLYKYH